MSQGAPLYLIEIVAWDPSLGTTRTLRYANRGFTTKASETPANAFYDERLKQPSDISRTMFSGASTRGRSTIALGDVILTNGDGLLDDLNELGFDGRTITVRRSTVFNPSYPSDFTTVFVGTMEQPEFSINQIRLKLRDNRYSVAAAPLQTNTYAGNNALPDGLEGGPELKGKVKPLCFGVVKNIAPPCVNTSKLIYQLNDGPIHSCDAVYVRGLQLQQGHAWNSAGTVGTGSFVSLWYGGGLWVRTSGANGTVYTSPDRITWTLKYTFGGATPSIDKAVYHAGEWLVSADHGAGPVFLHTTDDFTTVTTSAQPTGASSRAMFYHEAGALWIANAAGTVYSSPDAVTWTLRYTTPSVGGNFSDGAYLNGVGVLIGNDGVTGQGLAISSTDGITWIERVTGATTSAGLFRVTTGPDQFVAIGSGGASIVSSDGLTWTRAVMPAIASTAQLVYAEGLYLTFSTSTGLLLSSDGFEWGAYDDGLGVHLAALASDGVNIAISDTSLVIRYTTPSNYATLADLLDDNQAPLPFHWKAYLAGGYVRLGTTSDGVS